MTFRIHYKYGHVRNSNQIFCFAYVWLGCQKDRPPMSDGWDDAARWTVAGVPSPNGYLIVPGPGTRTGESFHDGWVAKKQVTTRWHLTLNFTIYYQRRYQVPSTREPNRYQVSRTCHIVTPYSNNKVYYSNIHASILKSTKKILENYQPFSSHLFSYQKETFPLIFFIFGTWPENIFCLDGKLWARMVCIY